MIYLFIKTFYRQNNSRHYLDTKVMSYIFSPMKSFALQSGFQLLLRTEKKNKRQEGCSPPHSN